MINSIRVKSFLILLILISSIFTIFSSHGKSDEVEWWNDDWSYNMKIDIPFDTSNSKAKFQPIDIIIKFDNPCWVEDTKTNSIRVCCLNKGKWYELESQIYDLKFDKNSYIKQCGLVFLIPEYCDGLEEYYVYYDDNQKINPDYTDHLDVEESYYLYEPISGYPLETYYYKIVDDGYIIYAFAKKGQIMGYDTGQHILKMKDKTEELSPKNQELFAAFDFKYTYDQGVFSYSSTSQKLIKSEILVDGNLMTEISIISKSKFDDLQTTAFYKYYHCPSSDKRIHAHIKHEALKDIDVYPNPPPTNTDGIFASMQMGGIESTNIEELNVGRILPYMHINDEKVGITKYNLDPDPEYIPGDPDVRVLKYQDDIDLANKAYITFDEGDGGEFHCLIFNSNNVIKSGKDEKDGIQVNSFQMDFPHFPGLENNIATVQAGRNSYEPGESHDTSIPKDFVVEFDAEFYSSKNTNLAEVDNEAYIFQELIKIKSYSLDNNSLADEEIETYPLELKVYFSPSLPMSSTLSAFLGLNISYVTAELYKDGELISSKSVNRLPMKPIGDIINMNLLQKITALLKSFDFKNSSFIKKVIFEDLKPGKYVIKIIKEESFIHKNPEYIGFKIIQLDKETKDSIICKPEGHINVEVTDQNNNKISNTEILLKKDETVIFNANTDEKGKAIVKAPIDSEPYNLIVKYNGFTFYKEPVKLNLIGKIFTKTYKINITLYNLKIKIYDTWDLPIKDIDLNPFLIINDDNNSNTIKADKIIENNYYFSNLKPGDYELSIKYKSYELKKDQKIKQDEEIEIIFPVEFDINIKTIDSRGNSFTPNKVVITRENKKTEIKDNLEEINVSVPPGIYNLEIYNEKDIVSKRNIDIFNKKTLTIITKQEPLYPTVVIIISTIIIFLSILLSYIKKDKTYFFKLIPVAVVISALFLSWWSIQGVSETINTSSNMYLLPANLITITENPMIIYGEQAYLPEIFTYVLTLLPIIAIIACIILLSSIILKKMGKNKIYLISMIFTIFLFAGSLVIYSIGMQTYNEIGVGSFIGQGDLDVSIPGGNSYLVNSQWGPGIGFYLIIFVIIWIILTMLIDKKK